MSEGKEPLTNNQLAELSLYKHLNTTRKKKILHLFALFEKMCSCCSYMPQSDL